MPTCWPLDVAASTLVSKPADDSQAILDAFETYRKAALAKDGSATAPVLMSNTFKVYDEFRKEALTGTEQTVATLRPSGRRLAYTMRGDLDHAMLRTASPQDVVRVIIDQGLVSEEGIRDIMLGELTIHDGKALARVTVRGEESAGFFSFALEGGAWKFDMPALFDLSDRALSGLWNQQGLTADQLFDQLLTTKYGPAKAAEVRKPVGG